MSLVLSEESIKEIVDDIGYLIEQNNYNYIKNILIDLHPADIAEIISYFSNKHREYIFKMLEPDVASEVLIEMDNFRRNKLLEALDEETITEIVDRLDTDDAADIVSTLPDEVAEHVLDSISEETSKDIQELLEYDEESAGGIMTKEMIAVRQEQTIGEVINEIKKHSEEIGEVYNIWVIDNKNVLVGALPLKYLFLLPPEEKVKNVMDTGVIYIESGTDQEEVANIFKKYNLVSAPVVDKDKKIIGKITVDDIVDVLQEEANEDISKMAGIVKTESEIIVEGSVFKTFRLRLPWLIVGFIGQIGSAFVMSKFEQSISQVLASAFFIPIIMAMGGNIGIQSSAIIVRGLATGEIEFKDIWKRLLKETGASFFNGVVLGILIFVIISFWLKNPNFGMVVGFSLLAVILNAAIVGTVVPLVLKKFDIDPAIATGPFITTANDVLGLLIYLGTMTVFLKFL
jgi:magnesium transporter